MNYLYRLEHFHNNYGYDQTIYIGLFSSVEKAEEVIDLLIIQPGFDRFPRDAFQITRKEIDHVDWMKGFETINGKDERI